jgi:hypothetical protein
MNEQWKTRNDDGDQPEGVEAQDEGAIGEPRKSRISANTLAVIGVFAIALTVIWALGRQAGPREAAAETGADDKVDSAIKELMERSGGAGQNGLHSTEKLVRLLSDNSGPKSPPAEQLPCNPFLHVSNSVPAANDPVPVALPVNPSLEEDARLRKLADSFATLKLQTVLMSKERSAAMINNRLVMVGGKIGEFVLAQIKSDRVLLSAGNALYELKLADLVPPKSQPDDQ